MCSLHYPSFCFPSFLSFDLLCLFSSASNMGNEVELFERVPNLLVIISFIETHALRSFFRWCWPFRKYVHNGFFKNLEIIFVCFFHYTSDRHSVCLRNQTSFYALFCPVGWVRTSFFPLQAVILSSLHPLKGNSNRYLSLHRIV